jgi:radical SAM protein with 4Fe4S-binding SPASM domain
MLTPNGFITKCESVIHDFTNNEIIGHISDLNNLDVEKINSWKEYKYDPNDELCKTCFYMTKCNRLKKCPDLSKCTPRYIKYLRNKLMFELNSVFANYIKKYKS